MSCSQEQNGLTNNIPESVKAGRDNFIGNIFNGNVSIASDIDINARVADWLLHLNPNLSSGISSQLPPSEYHNDIYSRVQPGTGKWLLNSSNYQRWLSSEKHNLVLQGMPGAGKTCLASIVIHDLHFRLISQEDPESTRDVPIMFLYNHHRRRQTQSSINMIASVLRQLFLHKPSNAEEVRDAYEEFHERGRNFCPTFEEIEALFLNTIGKYDQAFLIIDAWDECMGPDSDAFCDRNVLLSAVLRIQQTTKCNFLMAFTSRTNVTLSLDTKTSILISVHATDHDISSYINMRMNRSTRAMFHQADLRQLIESRVISLCSGMFLRARLSMDAILAMTKRNKVLEYMKRINESADILGALYESSIERIDANYMEIARRSFACLISSKRPLTMLELRHAVAVEPQMPDISEDDLDEEKDILTACVGLIDFSSSKYVTVVHATAQDFLVTLENSWLSRHKTYLATATADYLAIGISSETPSSPAPQALAWHRSSFTDYSFHFWARHVPRTFDKSSWTASLRFLTDSTRIEYMVVALVGDSVGPRPTWFHLLAAADLLEMAEFLANNLVNGKDVGNEPSISSDAYSLEKFARTADGNGYLPFVYAAFGGHSKLMLKLLKLSGTALDQWTEPVSYALKGSIHHGHEKTAILLLDIVQQQPDPEMPYFHDILEDVMFGEHVGILERVLSRDQMYDNLGLRLISTLASVSRKFRKVVMDCAPDLQWREWISRRAVPGRRDPGGELQETGLFTGNTIFGPDATIVQGNVYGMDLGRFRHQLRSRE